MFLGQNAKKLRMLAGLIAAFFLFEMTGQAAMPAISPSVSLPLAPSRQSLDYRIPDALGSVNAIIPSSSNKEAQTLFHVQDAHGSYEAQQNIKAILEYLVEKEKIETIFFEGSTTELDPTVFHFFQDHQLNLMTAESLMKKGDFHGAEYFLLKRNPVNEPRSAVRVYGMESENLYKEDWQLFRSVLQASSSIQAYLEMISLKLDTIQSLVVHKDLRPFLTEWKLFKQNDDFYRYMNELVKFYQNSLGHDLSDGQYQFEYPALYRFLKIRALAEQWDEQVLEREKKDLLLQVETKLGLDVRHELSLVLDEGTRENPRYALEKLHSSMNQVDIHLNDYAQLASSLRYRILEAEIDSDELNWELGHLTEVIFAKMSVNSEEERLIELMKDFFLLKQFLSLEVSREGYDAVLLKGLSPETMSVSLHVYNKGLDLDESMIKEAYQNAKKFYALAVKRETVFMQNILARMKDKKNKKAIFITGGFHSEGMIQQIKEKGFHYISIQPAITDVSDSQEKYLDVMLGGADKIDASKINPYAQLTSPANQIAVLGADYQNGYRQPRIERAKSEALRMASSLGDGDQEGDAQEAVPLVPGTPVPTDSQEAVPLVPGTSGRILESGKSKDWVYRDDDVIPERYRPLPEDHIPAPHPHEAEIALVIRLMDEVGLVPHLPRPHVLAAQIANGSASADKIKDNLLEMKARIDAGKDFGVDPGEVLNTDGVVFLRQKISAIKATELLDLILEIADKKVDLSTLQENRFWKILQYRLSFKYTTTLHHEILSAEDGNFLGVKLLEQTPGEEDITTIRYRYRFIDEDIINIIQRGFTTDPTLKEDVATRRASEAVEPLGDSILKTPGIDYDLGLSRDRAVAVVNQVAEETGIRLTNEERVMVSLESGRLDPEVYQVSLTGFLASNEESSTEGEVQKNSVQLLSRSPDNDFDAGIHYSVRIQKTGDVEVLRAVHSLATDRTEADLKTNKTLWEKLKEQIFNDDISYEYLGTDNDGKALFRKNVTKITYYEGDRRKLIIAATEKDSHFVANLEARIASLSAQAGPADESASSLGKPNARELEAQLNLLRSQQLGMRELLVKRKQKLNKLSPEAGRIRYSQHRMAIEGLNDRLSQLQGQIDGITHQLEQIRRRSDDTDQSPAGSSFGEYLPQGTSLDTPAITLVSDYLSGQGRLFSTVLAVATLAQSINPFASQDTVVSANRVDAPQNTALEALKSLLFPDADASRRTAVKFTSAGIARAQAEKTFAVNEAILSLLTTPNLEFGILVRELSDDFDVSATADLIQSQLDVYLRELQPNTIIVILSKQEVSETLAQQVRAQNPNVFLFNGDYRTILESDALFRDRLGNDFRIRAKEVANLAGLGTLSPRDLKQATLVASLETDLQGGQFENQWLDEDALAGLAASDKVVADILSQTQVLGVINTAKRTGKLDYSAELIRELGEVIYFLSKTRSSLTLSYAPQAMAFLETMLSAYRAVLVAA